MASSGFGRNGDEADSGMESADIGADGTNRLGVWFGLLAAILISYLIWRMSESLQGLGASSLGLSSVLLLAETYCVLALIAAALTRLVRPYRVARIGAAGSPAATSADVIVLLDDPALLAQAAYSLNAAARMTYPSGQLRLHVVAYGRAADAGQPLADLARQMGASWIPIPQATREGSALHFAHGRLAGTLTLVLRAGEAPLPEALNLLAARFVEDPRLGFIVLPHMAIDGDGALRGVEPARRLPAQKGPIAQAILRGGYDGSLAAPESVLWRRAALISGGGFQRHRLDPELASRLRAVGRGWRGLVAPFPMMAAMAPDTAAHSVRALGRLRLARIEAAITQSPGGLRSEPGLALEGASLTLWCGLPLAWLCMIALPMVAGIAGLSLFSGGWENWAWIGGPAALATLILMAQTQSGLSHLIAAVLVECALLSALFKPLGQLLLRPSLLRAQPALKPEPSLYATTALLSLGLASLGLSVAAAAAIPALGDSRIPLAVLAGLYAVLIAAALGIRSEPRQTRAAPRMPTEIEASLVVAGKRIDGQVDNMSVHGARFVTLQSVALEAYALLALVRLVGPHGPLSFPVQLSRAQSGEGVTCFGLAFSERNLIAFTHAVEAVHRSQERFAAMKDRIAARPSGMGVTLSSVWLGMRSAFQGRVLARA